MGRRKLNKEYSVKLTHSEFGDYYLGYVRNTYNYRYLNNITYIFTKNLNKVTTWKNNNYASKIISNITEGLNKNTCEVLLSFGTDVKDELKDRLICSRKKYYFKISFATSQLLINEAEKNIKSLDVSLINDCESMLETFKKGGHIDKDFSKKIKKLDLQVSSYRNDYYFLQKVKKNDVLLDVIDASYGFRTLKLKTLNNINSESEELD